MSNEAGLNNFIIVVKIDSFTNPSVNHHEMTTVKSTDIVQRLGTIALRTPEEITEYRYFVLDRELKLISIAANFIPENKQVIILLKKTIEFSGQKMFTIHNAIIKYLRQEKTKRFLVQVQKSFYKNLVFDEFSLDVLPNDVLS